MQTIGERLEEARKKKGISIREAAEATKIRGDYLQKFESNQFDIGLTDIYTRGFLRNYSAFLKISPERIMNDYAALGRGEVRPRQPTREFYGRTEVAVASAPEPAERAVPETEAPVAPEAAPARKPRFPRAGGALLSGPDPATVFKYVKWAGIGVGVIVLIFIIKAIFSGTSSTNSPARSPSAVSPLTASGRSFKLVAVDTVTVQVTRRVGESKGEEVFSGTLQRGQTQTIPWTDNLRVDANAGENLKIEWKGNRFPMEWGRGPGHGYMDVPSGP